jgi:alpha-1,2-mannosyltransferase
MPKERPVVSETVAATAAGGRKEPRAGRPAGSGTCRAGWRDPVNLAITVATVVALGLRVYYQYTRPGFLLGVNEYDDGPYFGSAVRLVHGVLPYRDFVLVQPPGITLLMTPAAALTYLTGTAWGLAIGRILTVAAGAAAVVLGGLLVRHRGLVAVTVTCGILAVYPDSVAAAHTVLVEPWLVLACLAAMVAVFDGDRLASSTRRLALGGVAFGFGGAIEGWAIVPVLVAFVTLFCVASQRRALAFAGGVAAGFCVPCLPFVAASPHGFYQSLITAQIGYRAHAYRIGPWVRLENLAGLPAGHSWSHPVIALVALAIVGFVAAAQAIAWLATGAGPPVLDWFAMVTGVAVVLMFMWPPQFHYHFAEFFAPFLALAVGLAGARLAAAVTAHRARLGMAVTCAAAVALAAMAAVQAQSESATPKVIGPVPAAVTRIIPAGACVLTDQVSVTLAANRFVSDVPGCPQMVDTLGTDLALSGGLKPGTGAGQVPAVAAVWRQAFSRAQYVLLTRSNDKRVPWTPSLITYFHRNFIRVRQPSPRLALYVRRGLLGHRT